MFWAFSRFTILAVVLTASSILVVHADNRSDAKAQVEFGILVAKQELWQEAISRWEQAVKIDPSYAAAWNNLGIACERQGLFDRASDAYEKALNLEPNNIFIQQNYDLFREVNDRLRQNDR